MKKILLPITAVLLGLTVSIVSCKKKDSKEEEVSVTPETPANQACDGTTKNTYYPLDSTDTWKYTYKIAGSSQPQEVLQVVGHQNLGGKKYATVKQLEGRRFVTDLFYYREDATTHDIYKYNTNSGSEYLDIPGNPVLNQDLIPYFTGTRKVTNLSASLTTPTCSYSGLLEISQIDTNGKVTTICYYKKGLGLVAEIESGAFGGEMKLTAATIK